MFKRGWNIPGRGSCLLGIIRLDISIAEKASEFGRCAVNAYGFLRLEVVLLDQNILPFSLAVIGGGMMLVRYPSMASSLTPFYWCVEIVQRFGWAHLLRCRSRVK